MKRTSSSHAPLVVIVLLAACGGEPAPTVVPPRDPAGPVERHLATRGSHRLAPHAYGRSKDRVIVAGDARYTFSTSVDEVGKKPLRGALVDADVDDTDSEDPLLWLRAGYRDKGGAMHPLVAAPEPTTCTDDKGHVHEGVRVEGPVEGATLTTTLCPTSSADGGLIVVTEAKNLPPDAELADDLGPGPSPVVLDRGGADWEGTHEVRALAVVGPKTSFVLVPRVPASATRTFVHIAKEVFPSPVIVAYRGARAERRLIVEKADPVRALAHAGLATERATFALGGEAGNVTFLDGEGRDIARIAIPPDGLVVDVPKGFAARARVSDTKGVPCATESTTSPSLAKAACPKSARIGFTVHADDHVPAPFHALVHGEEGTPDPTLVDLVPQDGKLRSVSARNSVYALDGRADVEVAPGKYHVIVTRGPGSTIDERHVVLAPSASLDVASEIRSVLPKGALAADFHLHAAPSPDSTVSLAERMATLASEGIGFAVATDHNRVTDYGPAKDSLVEVPRALFPELAVGDEITSGGGSLYGHFNAFPLAPLPPGVAPEDYTIPYFGVSPKGLFAGARRKGAPIVQVNHARMPPKIGYFDQVGFVAKTGEAGPDFADDFDAVEAHNGLWLESPERVREGLLDVIGLARRGKLCAATGNSDSHKLFLEEPGYPRTYVMLGSEAGTTETRVVAALKARSTVVSSGPYLEATMDGALPGSVVHPKGASAEVRVTVIAPAWIPVEKVTFLVDGEPVRTFDVTAKPKNGVRFRTTVPVRFDKDATFVVWVEAKAPLPRVLHEKDARAIAFTTPFYVDRDGDGKLTLTR